MLRRIGKDISGDWKPRFGISKRKLRRCGKLKTRGDIATLVVGVGRKAVVLVVIEPRESSAAVLDIDLERTPR